MIQLNFNNYLYKKVIVITRYHKKYRIGVGTLSGFLSQELVLYQEDKHKTTRIHKPVGTFDLLIPLDKGVSSEELQDIKRKLQYILLDNGKRIAGGYRFKN